MKVLGTSIVQQILRLFAVNVGEQAFQTVDAGGLDYTPATPANWNGAAAVPSTVAGALDILAQPAASTANGGPAGPAATITFDSGNIQSQKAGVFLVILSGSFTASAACTVTIVQRVDGITNKTFGTFTATAGQTVNFCEVAIATFVGIHTFGVGITVSAGNASAAASALQVTTVEL